MCGTHSDQTILRRPWTVCQLMFVGAMLAGHPAVAHGWTTISSPEFTSCLARVECQNETPCLQMEFQFPASSCFEFCIGSGMFPCAAVSSAQPPWTVSGLTEVQIPDVPPGGLFDAVGELATPDFFVVSGEFIGHPDYLGTAELAVFRYGGNPLAFEGLDIRALSDLIDLGLIGPDDVLLLETFDTETPSFSFDVDVSGIDAAHIVLFSSGVGIGAPDEPVPALSRIGLLVLLIGLLTATLVLYRGHSSSSPESPQNG